MTRFSFLYFAIILMQIGNYCNGQNTTLSGHLLVKNNDLNEIIAKETQIIINDNNHLRFADVDSNLNFIFERIMTDSVKIMVLSNGSYPDTMLNSIFLKNNEKNHIEIEYPPFCIYDKTKKDKTCPICKRHDKVIPIKYGLILVRKRKIFKRLNEYRPGGCNISYCDPHWYCKRDDKEF